MPLPNLERAAGLRVGEKPEAGFDEKPETGFGEKLAMGFEEKAEQPACVVVIARGDGARSKIAEMLQDWPQVIVSGFPPETEVSRIAAAGEIAVVLLECDSAKQLSILEKFRSGLPGVPVVLLAEARAIPAAMEAVSEGDAYDALEKPYSAAQLRTVVRRALEHRRLLLQNELYRHHLDQMIAARTDMMEHALRGLERSYDITLEALGDALDMKDAETQGHSKRVTAYTLALGSAVGLGGGELRAVGRGAFLHDIGKMAIPDAILRKPGKLDAAEQAIMRTHCELGYQMVRKIPFLQDAAEVVYAHQEFFDGSGYPRGLRGEQIPIGARIFAIADTLDAITSNRPYRAANTLKAARAEVLRYAGKQFDPAVVDVFAATPDSLWQELREGIMREGAAFSPFSYTFGGIE